MVRLIIEVREQPNHGEFVQNAIVTPSMLQVSHGHVAQADQELDELKLC